MAWGSPTSARSARAGRRRARSTRSAASACVPSPSALGRKRARRGRGARASSRRGIKVHLRAQLRYAGSDTALEVSSPRRAHAARLRAAHKAPLRLHRHGQAARDRERSRAEARRRRRAPSRRTASARSPTRVAERAARPCRGSARATRIFSMGAWRDANVYCATICRSARAVDGPALVIEPHQTIVVETGWRAEITPKNHVVMTRVAPPPKRRRSARRPIR